MTDEELSRALRDRQPMDPAHRERLERVRVTEVPHANVLALNLGASASENPTFSIVPIAGEEFTKRIVDEATRDE